MVRFAPEHDSSHPRRPTMAPHNEGTELGWVERFKAAFCKYIGEPCVYIADWYVENFLKTINLVLFGAMHWVLYQIFVSTSSDKLFRNLLNLLFWMVCEFMLLSIKYPVKALGLAAVLSGVCFQWRRINPTLTV